MKRDIELDNLQAKFLIKALQKMLLSISGDSDKEDKKRIVITKLINDLQDIKEDTFKLKVSKSQAKIINRIIVDHLERIEDNILPEYKNRLTKGLHKGKIDYKQYIDKTESIKLLLMDIKKKTKGMI